LRIAKQKDIEVIITPRGSEVAFDAQSLSFELIAEQLQLSEGDWLVNCVGWLTQKSSGNQEEDQYLATLLKTSLPNQLSIAKLRFRSNWIQMATDGLYKGKIGEYSSSHPKDAEDIHGMFKIAGKALLFGAVQIRSSIVGRDAMTTSGLYSWSQSETLEGQVNGFANHLWNGASTTAFARLSAGMLLNNWTKVTDQHRLTTDTTSKFDLLTLFGKSLWGDVIPVDAS